MEVLLYIFTINTKQLAIKIIDSISQVDN